jgi:16S rRNA processing protein RimM
VASDLISVGRVIKAHGIRGELRIAYTAESLDLLGDFIYLQAANTPPDRQADVFPGQPAKTPPNAKAPRKHKIRGLRLHHARPLLLLEGIADRSAAELLRNHTILVPAARLPKPDADEIYLRDLPGLSVFVYANGKEPWLLGSISSVQAAAGQEIWAITTPEGKEALFPATREFVLRISLAEGKALVAPPPGLLDIYLGSG